MKRLLLVAAALLSGCQITPPTKEQVVQELTLSEATFSDLQLYYESKKPEKAKLYGDIAEGLFYLRLVLEGEGEGTPQEWVDIILDLTKDKLDDVEVIALREILRRVVAAN